MLQNPAAFVFPGQGSQFVGMGKQWFRQFSEARQTFEEAEDTLLFNLAKLAFEGPLDQLSLTYHSQLTIFVTSIAIWRVVLRHCPRGNWMCAGMSLGEFSALVASEKGKFSEMLKLVAKRAQLMDQACKRVSSGMIAVMGLSVQQLEDALAKNCLDQRIWVANYNTPTQLVIAGKQSALVGIEPILNALGARTSRLAVEGGFHSPLMDFAQQAFMPEMSNVRLTSSDIAFVSGVSAQIEREPESIRAQLSNQMTLPVRWWQTVHHMNALHPRCFIEIGGKTLTTLQRRIGVKTASLALCEPSHLQSCLSMLS